MPCLENIATHGQDAITVWGYSLHQPARTSAVKYGRGTTIIGNGINPTLSCMSCLNTSAILNFIPEHLEKTPPRAPGANTRQPVETCRDTREGEGRRWELHESLRDPPTLAFKSAVSQVCTTTPGLTTGYRPHAAPGVKKLGDRRLPRCVRPVVSSCEQWWAREPVVSAHPGVKSPDALPRVAQPATMKLCITTLVMCLTAVLTVATASMTKRKPQTLSRGWGDEIEWVQTYEEGLFKSQNSNKPLMVIHHLESCEYCQSLKKAFASSQGLQKMADEDFIMLNLMHETTDKNLSPDGAYVPRIMFVDPSLTVRADITGPYHNRLYTYEPKDIDLLMDNMKKAKQLLKNEL
ncbi:uncharacterized protein LOC144943539 isoform X2 [Lampetra fluviatilis]